MTSASTKFGKSIVKVGASAALALFSKDPNTGVAAAAALEALDLTYDGVVHLVGKAIRDRAARKATEGAEALIAALCAEAECSPEEALDHVRGVLENEQAYEVVERAFKGMIDTSSPAARAYIAVLTAPYISGRCGPDRFFRRVARMLVDADSVELSELVAICHGLRGLDIAVKPVNEWDSQLRITYAAGHPATVHYANEGANGLLEYNFAETYWDGLELLARSGLFPGVGAASSPREGAANMIEVTHDNLDTLTRLLRVFRPIAPPE